MLYNLFCLTEHISVLLMTFSFKYITRIRTLLKRKHEFISLINFFSLNCSGVPNRSHYAYHSMKYKYQYMKAGFE